MFPHIPTTRLTGAEPFTLGSRALSVTLLSFWQWSASNLIGNTTRGCLAEYIVAMALGLTDGVRNDWEAYDLLFKTWKIEVKASGYLQSWRQTRLSQPVFGIQPARKWDPQTSEMSREPRRHADLYVFCLHAHKEKETLNPLDLTQWTFYVLPTIRLEGDERFKHAKTITLRSVLSLSPSVAPFDELGKCITDSLAQIKAGCSANCEKGSHFNPGTSPS